MIHIHVGTSIDVFIVVPCQVIAKHILCKLIKALKRILLKFLYHYPNWVAMLLQIKSSEFLSNLEPDQTAIS